MPRSARKSSESRFYHVILKGHADQDIVEDDRDRARFVKSLPRFKGPNVEIHHYCLMDNHAHILLRSTAEDLSAFMHDPKTSYALYFNLRHQRHGSLFAERFQSFPVETEEHYKAASRYIVQNPAKAGMASAASYAWSSFSQIGCEDIEDFVEWRFGENIFGSVELYRAFLCEVVEGVPTYLAPKKPVDEAIREVLLEEHGIFPHAIGTLPKSLRNSILRDLKTKGFTVAAICRVCGLGRSIVRRA